MNKFLRWTPEVAMDPIASYTYGGIRFLLAQNGVS